MRLTTHTWRRYSASMVEYVAADDLYAQPVSGSRLNPEQQVI